MEWSVIVVLSCVVGCIECRILSNDALHGEAMKSCRSGCVLFAMHCTFIWWILLMMIVAADTVVPDQCWHYWY